MNRPTSTPSSLDDHDMDNQPIQRFMLEDVPEVQRFQDANFQGPPIDAMQTAIMYGRAIQWISVLDVIWPDFEIENYYVVVLLGIYPQSAIRILGEHHAEKLESYE